MDPTATMDIGIYVPRIIARVAERILISSGTPWEGLAGYSRAVRVGSNVWVSGTTASDAEGHLQGGEDAYAQARYIFGKIDAALHEAGAHMKDVVRTRVFVARLEDWREV